MIVKSEGCFNCSRYENGELARKRWAEAKAAERTRLLMEGKDPDNQAYQAVLRQREAEVMAGYLGLCMAGKAGDKFIESAFMCEAWNGRTGARGPDRIGPLPGEYQDVLDKNKKS